MSHKSTRLGDLLIEQRTISAAQLRQAIDLQQARLAANVIDADLIQNRELGEILIELGFIDRRQLKSSLSWQRNLRRATTVMVFIAPLLTAACGGGGGSNASTGTNNALGAVSSQTITPNISSEGGLSSEAASSDAVAAGSSVISIPVSSAKSQASIISGAVSSSKAAVTSSSANSTIVVALPTQSSKVSVASSSAPAASSVASSSAKSGLVNGPVQLYWAIPKQRENGEYLDITEIGGYELRYKLKSDTGYDTITVADGFTDAYYFDNLTGDYEFEIATYDKNGLYSAYVAINPY